jgi:hypothetical protein
MALVHYYSTRPLVLAGYDVDVLRTGDVLILTIRFPTKEQAEAVEKELVR